MPSASAVETLVTSLRNRGHAMRSVPLNSEQWHTAYRNLIEAILRAQDMITAGRGECPQATWNNLLDTSQRQAYSARAEHEIVQVSNVPRGQPLRRPSEGGMTASQIRAYDQELAARQERARQREAAARRQPAPRAPAETPSTVSPEPVPTPPPTSGKVAPTAEQIAAIQRQYPGATTSEAAQIAQAGVVPTGTLARFRAWMNPTDRPVYRRPWFWLTVAPTVGVLSYFGYQKLTEAREGAPAALPAPAEPPALPPKREEG